MDISHVHFYVLDIDQSRDWFQQHLGLTLIGKSTQPDHQTVVLQAGNVVMLLSAPTSDSGSVAAYLRHHPPGVADLAFRVQHLDHRLQQLQQHGVAILQPIQTHPTHPIRWCSVQGWGDLQHTLIEAPASLKPERIIASLGYQAPAFLLRSHTHRRTEQDQRLGALQPCSQASLYTHIDHAVLNVGVQQLAAAVSWYQTGFGFRAYRYFNIQTQRSGLHSQVLVHPDGTATLPINEPRSSQHNDATGRYVPSQIQEFLDWNQGAGIQHIALRTANIVETVATLQTYGLHFLNIPQTYYQNLRQQHLATASLLEIETLAHYNILAELQRIEPPQALLQTFTQPIFAEPTFFFEVIERRFAAQGFGERNFMALFAAIEREQMKRKTSV